jgi:Flp pilus assembly protein TadG
MNTEARLSMSLKRDDAGASRRRERGVAPIELALSLTILVPLVLGMIDLGYYFYISVTAAEAARVGARSASVSTVGNCSNTGPVTAAAAAARAAANAYMTQSGLATISTTATAACTTYSAVTPAITPVWNVTMRVDFRPLVGVARTWMKPSPDTTCVGCVTFTQSISVVGS